MMKHSKKGKVEGDYPYIFSTTITTLRICRTKTPSKNISLYIIHLFFQIQCLFIYLLHFSYIKD